MCFLLSAERSVLLGSLLSLSFFYHLSILQHDPVFLISLSVHRFLFNHICPPYIFIFLLKE